MTEYCYPVEANQKYWIESLSCICRNCGNKFILDLPLGDDIVKLVEKDGIQVKWLPTWGTGGWLDLQKKFAPQLFQEDLNIRASKKLHMEKLTGAISMKIKKIMDVELPKSTEKGELGNGFVLGRYDRICPRCGSKELNFIKEQRYESSTLDWVKIDCELMKNDEIPQ